MKNPLYPFLLGLAYWFFDPSEKSLALLLLTLTALLLSLHHQKQEVKEFWFKTKTYGWGWTPTGWIGWLTILAYSFVIAFVFTKIDLASHSVSDTLLNFTLPFVISTWSLISFSWTTGEPPRWRWGDK